MANYLTCLLVDFVSLLNILLHVFQFSVASCHFARCKKRKACRTQSWLWTTGSAVDLEICFVPVLKCELLLCLPFMTSFLTIHFFPKSFRFLCRDYLYSLTSNQAIKKHLRVRVWSKFIILTRCIKPLRWWKVIIQRRTWVKSTSCGRKGTSSLYCQHLIRSGIKHFVTVQAKQRGRNIEWMLLCPLWSEPLH